MKPTAEKKKQNNAVFSKALLHPRYWLGWLLYGFLRLLLLLPYAWLFGLFSFLGYQLGPLFKSRRAIVRRNAELCFPEFSAEQQKAFIDDVIANTIIGFLETLYGWFGSEKYIRQHSRIEGLDLVKEAIAGGQGVILISGHFSSLDISGRIFSLHHRTSTSYKPNKNALLNFIINHHRGQHYDNLIEKREMRRMLKTLKNKEVIWYATDQDFGRKDSVFAPFFGVQTATLATLARLTQLSGAKPLQYNYYREGEGRNLQYVIRIEDAYSEGFSQDDVSNATLLNHVLEQSVRKHPEQYFWVHRRFKTRPHPDDPKIYQ